MLSLNQRKLVELPKNPNGCYFKRKVETVQICRVERDQFGRSYVGPVRKIRVHAGANHVKSQPTKVSIVSTFQYN